MFPEEGDGAPKLQIIEHPKSRGFRFRYTCEGPSHGGIPGASSDKNKKTFPAVKIVNYQGYARIVVQLVTNEENPRLHPHSLVGKQCQNGICTVQCGPKDMTATFPNLGIQHVTKKNVASILEERYIAAEMQLSSINDGFPQEVQRNIKDEDKKRIAAKAQSEAKSIDLSVVRLMFIAYLPDSQGAFTIMLKPIISDAIFDSKAPNAATLKICRMDCNAGSPSGGDEVYLLCDKVQKDDIQVRFVEEDSNGIEVWENYGNFCPTDVHRQFAIVFRTPPYKDPAVQHHVNVNVQLRRKSDGEVSEPRSFTYIPNKTDYDMIERKRRKVMPDYLDHLDGNNSQRGGYNFSSATPGNSAPNAYQFEGSSGTSSENVKKTQHPLKVADLSRRRPQSGPVSLNVLQKKLQAQSQPAVPANVRLQENPIRCSLPTNAIFHSANPSQQFLILTPVASTSSPLSLNNVTNAPVTESDWESLLVKDLHVTSLDRSLSSQANALTSSQQSSTSTASNLTSYSGYDVNQPSCNSFASSSLESNGDVQQILSLEASELMDFLNDIETDGVMDNTASRECDFASALYGDTSPKVQPFNASLNVADDKNDTTDNMLESQLKNLSIKSSLPTRNTTNVKEIHSLLSTVEESKVLNDDNSNSSSNMTAMKSDSAHQMAAAIHEYSITGDVRTLLLRQRHLTSTRDDNGDTVLHLAVIHNHLEVLSSILDVVATLDNRDEILNSVNNQQQTALQIATLSDNVDAVIRLLRAEANPLIPDRNGNHSIHVASRHGNADVLSRLLKRVHGEFIDTKNYKGLACFHLAVKAKKNSTQCMNLLKSYCDVDCYDDGSGRTALHYAVERGNISCVETLLSKCNADVDAATYDGVSPLQIALSSGSSLITSLLISYGAQTDDNTAVREILQRNMTSRNETLLNTSSTVHNILLTDSAARYKLCSLLNQNQTGSNWFQLADRLQLAHFKTSLKTHPNPTGSLLKLYTARQGTVEGLRSALMNIGRHDAVQVLNQATCKEGDENRTKISARNARDSTSHPICVM